MMHYLSLLCLFLIDVKYVRAEVTWKFPTPGNNIQANAIDTVLLDWNSTLGNLLTLQIWCTNGPDGDPLLPVLGVSTLFLYSNLE
jgi:hypothetical protein